MKRAHDLILGQQIAYTEILSGYDIAKKKSNSMRHRMEVGFLENIPEESP